MMMMMMMMMMMIPAMLNLQFYIHFEMSFPAYFLDMSGSQLGIKSSTQYIKYRTFYSFCPSFFLFITVFADCYGLLLAGNTQSGVYSINPDGRGEFDVFCDQSTRGGGWIVFQKRFNGLVDFFRNWTSYKVGFGNLTGEFWLGFDKIHRLSSLKMNSLRVDLADFTNASAYAEYDDFKVLNEQDSYALDLGKYTGILKRIKMQF